VYSDVGERSFTRASVLLARSLDGGGLAFYILLGLAIILTVSRGAGPELLGSPQVFVIRIPTIKATSVGAARQWTNTYIGDDSMGRFFPFAVAVW
jgi:hypothetical protein